MTTILILWHTDSLVIPADPFEPYDTYTLFDGATVAYNVEAQSVDCPVSERS